MGRGAGIAAAMEKPARSERTIIASSRRAERGHPAADAARLADSPPFALLLPAFARRGYNAGIHRGKGPVDEVPALPETSHPAHYRGARRRSLRGSPPLRG